MKVVSRQQSLTRTSPDRSGQRKQLASSSHRVDCSYEHEDISRGSNDRYTRALCHAYPMPSQSALLCETRVEGTEELQCRGSDMSAAIRYARVSFSTFGLCLIPLSLAEHRHPREVQQSSSGSWVSDQMSHRTIVPEPLISLTSLHSSIVWWKGPPGIRTQHAPLFVSCLPCSSSRFSSDKLCACCLDFFFFEPLVEYYGHCNTEMSGISRGGRDR